MEFDEIILQEVRRALINDSSFSFRKAGNNLRQGICPNCGERECFVNLAKPWRVSCGRLNNCQWSATTRELYPEIFENFKERYPATESDPDATADAYLQHNRGFSLSKIKGMYHQGYRKKSENEYFPTVKFIINQNCYWQRIIDSEDVRKNGAKTHIYGDYRNIGWMPPEMTFEEGDTIWITEAIFKSIAFLHLDQPIKSIAALSSSNLPRDFIKANLNKKITWVIAEDNDPAGHKAAKKYKQELEALGERVKIAFPEYGEDWDDAYKDGKLTASYLNESFYRGFLVMADSYQQKAFFHYCRYQFNHSVIDFQNALYSYKINEKSFDNDPKNKFKYPDPEKGWDIPKEKIDQYFTCFTSFTTIKEICPCKPEFLYIEKDIITQERTNCFFIEFANHTPSMLFSNDGTIYKSADNFSNGLLKHTGYAPFTGSNVELSILHKRWFHKRIKFVQSVPFCGYEPKTGIYVFPDFAYHKGQHQKVNKHGFFSFNRNSVKCTLDGFNFVKGVDDFGGNWINDFYHAFDLNGMVLLAWWMGTLFAEQIRAKQDSWPFLEYTGAPGAGKSSQLRFMWRCLGVDGGYEGFDPNKSTLAGRSAQMTQGSNLPVVLLEADRHDDGTRKNIKSFNFSEIKNLYNGGTMRIRGTKTQTAQTNTLKFRGGICISQNAEVEGEEAILERIVHCHCTKAHFNEENADAANRLRDMTALELGGFLHAALSNERKLFDGYLRIYKQLHEKFMSQDNGQIGNWRIIHNHAQVAAWLWQLPTLFGNKISGDQLNKAEEHIWSRAISRKKRLASDHPLLEQFWDIYEFLNVKNSSAGPVEVLNHSTDSKQIAINMPSFQEIASHHRQNLPSSSELIPLFPASKKHKCIGLKPTRSKILNKIIKCWVFRNEEDKQDE